MREAAAKSKVSAVELRQWSTIADHLCKEGGLEKALTMVRSLCPW